MTTSYFELAQSVLGDAFVKAEPVAKIKLDKNDVFVWCGEIYIVEEAYDTRGEVRYLNGAMASNKWYWNYGDQANIVIGTIKH